MTGLLGTTSCLKPSDSDMQVSLPKPHSGTDIHEVLAQQPGLALYNQAYKRLGIDKEMDHNKGYTIFAVKDAGMIAAGLTAGKISSLPLDSLSRLIRYHILSGALDDNAILSAAFTLITPTFRQDTIPFREHYRQLSSPLLYVSGNSKLYLNDYAVCPLPSAIKAANGYIYAVDSLVQPPPARTMLNIVDEDPELSLYRFALNLRDSIFRDPAVMWDSYDLYTGSDTFFLDNYLDEYGRPRLAKPTILAPTNAAFRAAGLGTEEDIRNFALSAPTELNIDWNTYLMTIKWSPLDSILKRHILHNEELLTGTTARIPVLYNDLASSTFNNSLLNTYKRPVSYWGPPTYIGSPHKLQFLQANGGVQVRYNPGAVANIIRQPGNKGIAVNGAVYKTDQLFKPR